VADGFTAESIRKKISTAKTLYNSVKSSTKNKELSNLNSIPVFSNVWRTPHSEVIRLFKGAIIKNIIKQVQIK